MVIMTFRFTAWKRQLEAPQPTLKGMHAHSPSAASMHRAADAIITTIRTDTMSSSVVRSHLKDIYLPY